MSGSTPTKPARKAAPEKLGRSAVTGTYILKPLPKRLTVSQARIAEIVKKVIASRRG